MSWIASLTGAHAATADERIQSLWSGYGEVRRVRLRGGPMTSVVLKSVKPPTEADHPQGWNTDRSHERKLKSYGVEMQWYREYAYRCGEACRVPECLATRSEEGRWLFVLEDLDNAGFPDRRTKLSSSELDLCLQWLAAFHAEFLGEKPDGLWEVGTYWHLATRPDELKAIEDDQLRDAAPAFDRLLNQAQFQTLVHGDAKVANFCFAPKGNELAGVDFQYVGGGAGIKDVAYLLSSCLSSRECERQADACLDSYFSHLRERLASRDSEVDVAALEAEWRSLYPVAWADFVRFLAGWSPEHWKMHGYSIGMLRRALEGL